MKRKIEPLMRERVMREVDLIVSKTDAKGRITCTKRIFMEFAGYGEAELLGSQHDIVRHPDMPRAVFRYRWGNPAGWTGVVRVRQEPVQRWLRWVFANVSPTLDER